MRIVEAKTYIWDIKRNKLRGRAVLDPKK